MLSPTLPYWRKRSAIRLFLKISGARMFESVMSPLSASVSTSGSPTLHVCASIDATALMYEPSEPMNVSGRPSVGGGVTRTFSTSETARTDTAFGSPPFSLKKTDPLKRTGAKSQAPSVVEMNGSSSVYFHAGLPFSSASSREK